MLLFKLFIIFIINIYNEYFKKNVIYNNYKLNLIFKYMLDINCISNVK